MATFKAVVLKNSKREVYNVKIRLTHNRVNKYIPTPFNIGKDELTKSYKIKNQIVMDDVEDIIKRYRIICNSLGERIHNMTVQDISSYFDTHKDPRGFQLDFIEYGHKKIMEMKKKGRTGSASCYSAMLNTLKEFTSRDVIDVNEITVDFMKRYSQWLGARPLKEKIVKGVKTKIPRGTRTLSFYPTYIRALHNMAKFEFNDDDNGIINISLSPFIKFKIPKVAPTRKRAISSGLISTIAELEYAQLHQPGISRLNLAKDVFILSFCLIGMNTADLYACEKLKNGWITYNRAKTKDRRDDNAEISIHIEPEIEKLVKKYRDKTGKRVFNFYQNYSSQGTFNTAVNKGLKQIGEVIGEKDLEFYAARHSWATIAINDVLIDKYTVHSALNHVDKEMKVTEIYIKKTYSIINDANRKVLDYLKLKIIDPTEPIFEFKRITTLNRE